jgi:hypothetical protein
MNVSWGVGLAAIFAVFVCLVLTMVALSMALDVDLVTEAYYDHAIDYGTQISVLQRTAQLHNGLQMNLDDRVLVVQFPEYLLPAGLSGTITLYRPSNRLKDFAVPVSVDSTFSQRISTSQLDRGLWRVLVSWRIDGTDYYSEQQVMLL